MFIIILIVTTFLAVGDVGGGGGNFGLAGAAVDVNLIRKVKTHL